MTSLAPAPAPPAAAPGPVSRPGPRRTAREATLICGRQLAILRANPAGCSTR